MRLDKYLKVSRLIKRRTLANEVASNERVMVNEKVVKPSYQLKVGDVITIFFGNKEVKIRVNSLTNSSKKEDAMLMYELISETKKNI